MEEVLIPQDFVFIGHCYLQHAGGEGQEKYCQRYYMYLIPEYESGLTQLLLRMAKT